MVPSKCSPIHSVCPLSAYRSPNMTNWSYFGWHMALEQMAEQTQFSLPARQAGTATKGRLHTPLSKDIPVSARQNAIQPLCPVACTLGLQFHELASRVL